MYSARVKRYIQTEAENHMKISEKLKEIERDRLNGSVTISYSILGAFMEGRVSTEDLASIISDLENTRNTFSGMGLVRNICSILQATIKKNEDPVEMSHNLFSEIETSSSRAVENADAIFQEKVSFVTISNSSMIKEILDRNSKNIRMVSLLESRPNLEAIELAKYLKGAGIPCTIYVDASTFLCVPGNRLLPCGIRFHTGRLQPHTQNWNIPTCNVNESFRQEILFHRF